MALKKQIHKKIKPSKKKKSEEKDAFTLCDQLSGEQKWTAPRPPAPPCCYAAFCGWSPAALRIGSMCLEQLCKA